jgi:sarcosine oxidase delta subunit
MTTDTLLPCPFCGQTYIIQGNFDFRGDGPDKFPNDVVCSGCGIGYCGHEFKGQGDASVVAAWNTRAHDADKARIAVLEGTLRAVRQPYFQINCVCGRGHLRMPKIVTDQIDAALTTQASEVE